MLGSVFHNGEETLYTDLVRLKGFFFVILKNGVFRSQSDELFRHITLIHFSCLDRIRRLGINRIKIQEEMGNGKE